MAEVGFQGMLHADFQLKDAVGSLVVGIMSPAAPTLVVRAVFILVNCYCIQIFTMTNFCEYNLEMKFSQVFHFVNHEPPASVVYMYILWALNFYGFLTS